MKKVIALLLAVLMLSCVFAGCGNSTTSSTSSTGGTSTLKIGGIGPITGGAAVYGLAVKNGAELAIKEINAAGGVNGMKLEMNFQDDEHNAEKAVNAYNTLKDWGMQLLMGTVTSAPCTAVVAESSADNMFQLTPSGSAVESIAGDNAFRVCFSDPNQGIASAQYISNNKLATKIAVIYNSSDVYSSGIYEKFAAEAKTLGLNIVTAQAFTDDSKTDFSVQIKKAQDAGADLVFLPIYYNEATTILKQCSSKGYSPKFFGCDGLDGILTVENFDTKLAEGVMLLTPFAADATDTLTQNFVKEYKAANNDEVPNQFAADAYDAIYTIKAALEKAEVKDASINASDLCDKLKVAMTQIELKGVTGTITWAADGEPSKDPKAVVIKDGAYKAM